LDVAGTGRFSDGILFGADTAAANTLHDYEEGDWTPTINEGGTWTVTNAKYVKIGSFVQCWAVCTAIVESGIQIADLIISGLPFTPEFDTNGGNVMMYGVGTNANNLNVWVKTNDTLRIYETLDDAIWDPINWNDIATGDRIYYEFCYKTTE
jgi:hypothetical protein